MKTKKIATRAIFTIVILLTIVTIAAAQPSNSPGGGGGQGQGGPPPGTNPVPIDPASWLIPAGMGAYAWYKKRKEGKTTEEEA
ncbi:MAG: hypothetical protein IPH78_12195 [Bacteroidetes bacterium]|nr:hypothetical protein [Bacteroidota bacterium]